MTAIQNKKKKRVSETRFKACGGCGGLGRIRTCDLGFSGPSLYPLSYEPLEDTRCGNRTQRLPVNSKALAPISYPGTRQQIDAHQMSSGHAHHGVKLGDHEVDQALANPSVRRQLARTPRFDRSWDVPYLGGYSVDGRTVYLDRHLPKTLIYRGAKHGYPVDIDRFLILHEEVEKALIDQLEFSYAHAHEVATRAEENAVRAAGIEVGWYRKALKPFIKADARERLLRVPNELDMTPYRAPPMSEPLLKRIAAAQKDPGAPGKIKPAEAHYGPGHAHSHCALCAHFRAPNRCDVLQGSVQPNGWCEYFAKIYEPQEHAHG